MAQNSINIGITIDDNGTARTTVKNIKEILRALTETQKAASQGINMGPTTAGFSGTAGSRAAAQAARPTSELQAYGAGRGAMGATGASARDFANQAQGLGGLVRLYATYAANIFALSAAFRSLSASMDTANMVQGLNQLGASSGVALGSLSKQLANTTDNAISLREAMEATVKASSSGMNSEQILQMGKVAKQASLALGVDMSDAMSRLSRGIVKLEPELLDELALFTRTGKAAEDYAKSVGKSVMQLTDFERRQAFANAVLAEGQQKFGEIDIEANPYTILAAQLKNLTDTGLNLINQVLVPLVGKLSESPGALTAGMAALVSLVLKQAVPAFGQFKESLQSSAQTAATTASEMAIKAKETQRRVLDLELEEIEKGADAKLALLEKAEAEAARQKFDGAKVSVAIQKLLNTDVQDLREEDFKNARDAANKQEEQARRWERSSSKSYQTRAARQLEEVALTRSLVKELEEHQRAEERLAQAKLQAQKTVEAGGNFWSISGQRLRLATKEQEAAAKSAILSNASYNASLVGVAGAFRLLQDDIAKSSLSLGFFGKTALYARASVSMLVGALSTVGAAVGGLLGLLGTITAVVAILDSFASNKSASTALKDFTSSSDRASSSAETLAKTLDKFYKAGITGNASLKAQANAIVEISASLDDLIEKTLRAKKVLAEDGSLWQGFKEGVKNLFGFGIENSFQEVVEVQLRSVLRLLETSPDAAKFRKRLADVFNLDASAPDFSSKILKVAETIKASSPQAEALAEVLKEISLSTNNASSRVEEFDAGLLKLKESTKEFTDQFKLKDPLLDMLEANTSQLIKMDNLLTEGPLVSLESLIRLSQDVGNTLLFSAEQTANIAQYQNQLQELKRQLDETLRSQQAARETAAISAKALAATDWMDTSPEQATPAQLAQRRRDAGLLQAARLEVSRAEQTIAQLTTQVARISQVFRQDIEEGLTRGATLAADKIALGLAQGSTNLLQSIYAKLGALGLDTSKQETSLKLRELDIQVRSISIQQELINEHRLSRAELAKNSAAIDKASAVAELNSAITLPSGDPSKTARVRAATDRVVNTTYLLDQEIKKYELLALAIKKPEEAVRSIGQSIRSVGPDITGQVTQIAQQTQGYLKQLRDLNDQKTLIPLEGALKAEDQRLKNELQIQERKAETLRLDQEGLRLQLESGSLTQQSFIEEARTIEISRARLDYENQILRVNSEAAQAEIIIRALRDQGRVADADTFSLRVGLVKLSKEDLAQRSRDLAIATAQVSATTKLLQIRQKLTSLAKETQRLEEATQAARLAAEIDLADQRLNLLEASGTLRQSEINSRRQEISQARESLSLETKLADLQRKYTEDAQRLAETYTDLGAEGLVLVQQQQLALAKKYTQEIEAATRVYNLRKAISEETLRTSEESWFTDGVTSAIIEAFTKGGKTAADSLKSVFKEKLFSGLIESLQVSLRSVVKDFFKFFTGGSGVGSLKDIFEAFKGGDLSKLGTSIFSAVSSFASLFSPNAAISKGFSYAAEQAWLYGYTGVSSALTGFAAGMAKGGKAIVSGNLSEMTGSQIAGAVVGGVLNGMAALTISDVLSNGYKTGVDSIVKAATAVAGFVFGPIGGVVAGLFNRAFGRKTTSQGIEGTFGGNVGFSGNTFEFQKGGWFRSDKTIRNNLDAPTQNYLATTFQALQASVYQSALSLGAAAADASRDILGYTQSIRLDLQGKSADQVKELFTNLFTQIGENLSERALYLLSFTELVERGHTSIVEADIRYNFEQFRKLGETYAELLTRVTQSIAPANQALELLNITLFKSSLSGGAAAAALTEGFGGLEQFSQSTMFFFDNFYNDADKLVAKTNQVQRALLNIANNSGGIISGRDIINIFDGLGNSRDDYRNLVSRLDLTTAAGQNLFTALISLAPVIAEVTDSLATTVLTVEDVSKQFRQLQVDILRLQGRQTESLTLERQLILENLDGRLVAAQEYVFALEDVKSAQELLTKLTKDQYNLDLKAAQEQTKVLESTVTALERFVNKLKNFRDSLLLSQNTVLTPLEQYQFAKDKFDSLLAQALSTETGEEASRVRNIAREELDSAARAFLDSSRAYFASSTQYSEDFNTVLKGLDTSIAQISNEQSSAEQALKAAQDTVLRLETVISSLDKVSEGISDIAQATNALADAISKSLAVEERYLSSTGLNFSGSTTSLQESTTRTPNTLLDLQKVISKFAEPWAAATRTEIDSLYREIVQRTASSGEVNSWISKGATVSQIATNLAKSDDAKAAGVINAVPFDPRGVAYRFADPNRDASREDVTALYRQLMGRDPDPGGLEFWDNSGLSAASIIENWLANFSQHLAPVGERGFIVGDQVYGVAEKHQKSVQSLAANILDWMRIGSPMDSYGSLNPDVKDYWEANNMWGNQRVKSIFPRWLDFAVHHWFTTGQYEGRAGVGIEAVQYLWEGLVQRWGLDSRQVSQILGWQQNQVLDWFTSRGLPSFAQGTNYLPEDMIAQVHKGERIVPAADNKYLIESMSNRNAQNIQLIKEIQSLRHEVHQLREQQKQETAMLAEATYTSQASGSNRIVLAVSDSTDKQIQANKARQAVKLN
jgi:hypothetical protein